jgi:hypothetical protein
MIAKPHSMTMVVYWLTLAFGGLPWFIKFSLIYIDNPEMGYRHLLFAAYPEFAFIPIALVLYTFGLAAENLAFTNPESNKSIIPFIALTGVGGLICLCSYFVFVAKEKTFMEHIGTLTGLEYFFFGAVALTMFSSLIACYLVHIARKNVEAVDV